MNIYKNIWDNNLKNHGMPSVFTGCTIINFKEFKKQIENENKDFAENIINDLVCGKVILIKSALSENFVKKLKINIKNFWRSNPDTFFKMLEGCPDFHRIISPEKAKNYSVNAVKHATYFFPWNNDPCGINAKIFNRWGYIKKLCGLEFDEFQKNTPKDIKVDRIQVAVYPPGFGELETHTDPVNTTPVAISGYLSSIRSGDFYSGGFYCVNENGEHIDLEDSIDIGDMSFFCATVKHGVKAIDEELSCHKSISYDWNSGQGRWFLGLYTNDSDETQSRTTSVSYKNE